MSVVTSEVGERPFGLVHFSRFPLITTVPLAVPFVFDAGLPSREPERLGGVIAAAFRRATQELDGGYQPGGRRDQWTQIIATQRPVFDVLHGGDPLRIVSALENACHTDAGHGFMQNRQMTETYKADTGCRAGETLLEIVLAKGGISALAQYLGVADVRAPWEQPDPSLYLRLETAVEGIEAAAGTSISVPNHFRDLFAMRTPRGLFTSVSVRALYTALRIREVLEAHGIPLHDAHVCEIGGGAGYLAYFANRLGIGRYTIIDIPLSSAVQAFNLGNLLGLDQVGTYERFSGVADRPVNLLPPQAFEGVADADISLFVNENSLPEIDRGVAEGYLRGMTRRPDRLFLSINQESRHETTQTHHRQTPVRDVVAAVGGFRRLSRHPHWLTHGYCEELFATRRS